MLWAKEGETKDSGRQPADSEYDPMSDPLLRDLKRIIPYHPMWNDPAEVSKFAEGLHRDVIPEVAQQQTHSVDISQQSAAPPDGRIADHEFITQEGAKRWNRSKRM